ncbi:MAG: hypothetical protein IK137_00370 [Bacilli bacterium]|nr:hypothetical protein [Bacilli bacterium]
MDKFIRELILFLISYVIVFLLYQIFVVKKAKSKKKPKEPFEVTYLVKKYKLDLDKVNYNKLLLVIAIVSSLDISLVVTAIALLKSFVLEMIVGFFGIIFIILLSYYFVYLIYKKKGMIKDEHKGNRK